MRYLLIVFLFSTIANAALQYLVRSTPPHSSFETVNTDFYADYHTSNKTYDDAVDQDVNIGFSFQFNGTSYSKVHINSNGTLSFTDNDDTSYDNKHVKDSSKSQIFPYWDDLNLGDDNSGSHGKIKYGTIGSGDNKHFVVSWESVRHYQNSGKYTFQVILYTDGSIRFRYDGSSDADGASATIGVKEDDDHYDEYSYNAQIDRSKDVLYSPKAPPSDDDYSDYHFDELYYDGTDKEIKDSHLGNDATGNNAKVAKGILCNAIDLRENSKSDYAKIPPRALDGVTDFTISVWHKGDSSKSRALISAANSSEDNEILLWMKNTTTFTPHIKGKNNKKITTTDIFDGNWHHIVWRLKNKKNCFYVDGQKQGCKTYDYSPNTLSVDGLILGQDQDSVGGGFSRSQDWEGLIDELIIFRKALDDSEISDIYNNQKAGKNWDGSIRVCPYPKVKKLSCVIDDPVNDTNKPKRIPGATIRYTLEVENPNTSKIDATTSDELNTSLYDISTIKNLKIANGTCNCQNPNATYANGSNGSNDGENPVKLDYGTVEGKSTKCGYFEANIK